MASAKCLQTRISSVDAFTSLINIFWGNQKSWLIEEKIKLVVAVVVVASFSCSAIVGPSLVDLK